MSRFNLWRERKVDWFQKYKEAQRVQVKRVVTAHARSKKGDRVPRRDRAKDKRGLKKEYGLTRSHMGAIGAGHMKAPWEE